MAELIDVDRNMIMSHGIQYLKDGIDLWEELFRTSLPIGAGIKAQARGLFLGLNPLEFAHTAVIVGAWRCEVHPASLGIKPRQNSRNVAPCDPCGQLENLDRERLAIGCLRQNKSCAKSQRTANLHIGHSLKQQPNSPTLSGQSSRPCYFS